MPLLEESAQREDPWRGPGTQGVLLLECEGFGGSLFAGLGGSARNSHTWNVRHPLPHGPAVCPDKSGAGGLLFREGVGATEGKIKEVGGFSHDGVSCCHMKIHVKLV